MKGRKRKGQDASTWQDGRLGHDVAILPPRTAVGFPQRRRPRLTPLLPFLPDASVEEMGLLRNAAAGGVSACCR